MLKSFPNDFCLHCCSTFITLKQGKDKNEIINHAFKALEILRRDIDNIPHVNQINALGVVFQKKEYFTSAIECFEIALAKKPDLHECAYAIADIYKLLHNYDLALKILLKEAELYPNSNVFNKIASTLFTQEKISEAMEYLDKAIELSPENPATLHNIAISLNSNGRSKEAKEHLRKGAELFPDYIPLYCELVKAVKFDKNNEEYNIFIDKINRFLKTPNLEKSHISKLNFALAKICNDIKEYDNAIHYFVIANNYKVQSTKLPTVEIYKNTYIRHINTYTSSFFKTSKRHGHKTAMPIFIVGMPRSGTTLTEQIIAGHSKAYGAGETPHINNIVKYFKPRHIPGTLAPFIEYPEMVMHLSKEEIQNFATQYLNNIKASIPGNFKIIDKMPDNSCHVGFIKLIFPNSTIIHCKRHPLDTILSIFFRDFVNLPYSNSIDSIITHYKFYDAYMKHWHVQLPGKIYDSYYEELVYKQEEKSHELIKACGLKWEDACLDFHNNDQPVFTASLTQVKEPMYKKSVFSWKKYEKHLGQVKEALKNEIAEYETEIIRRVPELREML